MTAPDLQPLLDAPGIIQIHAFAAFAAFALGTIQLAGIKGTLQHRTFGWIWVAIMATIALSSFWVHEIRLWGQWSYIHILSILTLAILPLAVLHARHHNVCAHRRAMLGLFFGALVVAGIFTVVPGRIMHAVFFGN